MQYLHQTEMKNIFQLENSYARGTCLITLLVPQGHQN